MDRIYLLQRLPKTARYPVSRDRRVGKLQCSESTAYGTPLVPISVCRWKPSLVRAAPIAGLTESISFELPSLWLNASELYAPLAGNKLLADAPPGQAAEELKPKRNRIQVALGRHHLGGRQPASCAYMIGIVRSPIDFGGLRILAEARVEGHRLSRQYSPKFYKNTNAHEVLPQHLTCDRDNWYHNRNDLRTPYGDPTALTLNILRHGEEVRAVERDTGRRMGGDKIGSGGGSTCRPRRRPLAAFVAR